MPRSKQQRSARERRRKGLTHNASPITLLDAPLPRDLMSPRSSSLVVIGSKLKPPNVRSPAPPRGGVAKTLSPSLHRASPSRAALRSPTPKAIAPHFTAPETRTKTSKTPKVSPRTGTSSSKALSAAAASPTSPKAKSPAQAAAASASKVSPAIKKQSVGTPPSRSPSSKSGGIVRVMQEGDAEHVCTIWRQGLQQTVQNTMFGLQWASSLAMSRLESSKLSPSGEFGPNGCNIMKSWVHADDRTMFVAQAPGSSAIIGCCAVKRGVSDNDHPPKSFDTFSMHRLSVSESSRHQRVGSRLVKAAEDWAKSNGGSAMVLDTVNVAASAFYVGLGYKKQGLLLASKHVKQL